MTLRFRAAIKLPLLLFVLGFAAVVLGQQASVYESGFDPYFFLVRDGFVHDELELSAKQKSAIRQLTDTLDQPLLAVRGQDSRTGPANLLQLLAEIREGLQRILTGEQQRRLGEIRLRVQGIRSLLRDELAKTLELTNEQRERLTAIAKQTDEGLQQEQSKLRDGSERTSIEQAMLELRRDEQKQMLAVLDDGQKAKFVKHLGSPLDLAKIGNELYFKAPAVSQDGEWINSSPLALPDLRGKVVAVHFWAFGCINCIHNYPAYTKWQETFADQDFVMIGIHTPETSAEYKVESVRRKVQEANFEFPVVVDNDKTNWTTWGNTVWPSVYLIDKQGYIRYWWYGELNWQGAKGEALMTQRIEELLAE